MRISDWSSDVCSSDLADAEARRDVAHRGRHADGGGAGRGPDRGAARAGTGARRGAGMNAPGRSWRQHWPMPSQPRPIMISGTGGIVKDAHLPAYRKGGFTVAGLYDHDRARAEALASEWGIDTVFDTLEQAAAADAAFDVADRKSTRLNSSH